MKTKRLLTTASRLKLTLVVLALAGLNSTHATNAKSVIGAKMESMSAPALGPTANGTADELRFVEALFNNTALDGAQSVAVSPDGGHVYVASVDDDAVVAFRRDGTTGALTFVEMEQDGVGIVDGLDGAWSVAISPDGDHVYVAGFGDDAVVAFSRDKTTGELTYVETEWDNVAGVDGLDNTAAVAVSPDGSHVYVAGLLDSAVVAFSRDKNTGELTYVETEWDNVAGVDGLEGAYWIAVSPDGHHVYVVGTTEHAVAVFSRNGSSGELGFVEMKQNGSGGVSGLERANAVTVSPDGHHVYVTGFYDDAVAVFGRNVTTGMLTQIETEWNGVGGTDGLDGAWAVEVSPDGDHVYVTGYWDDAVVVFNRDRITGELTHVETEWNGVGGIDGLDGARGVAISPYGDHVYIAAYSDDAVVLFNRRVAADEVTFVEMKKDGVDGVDGLYWANEIAISPDGDHVYVAAYQDDAVAVFGRSATTGRLTYVEMEQDGAGGVNGLAGTRSVAVSPDGDHVYAVGFDDNAVVVFARDKSTGALSYVETKWDGVGEVQGLYGPHSLVVSPDGDYVYVASFNDNALTSFKRDKTTGTLSFWGMQQDSVAGVNGLAGARTVTVSPDGDHAYVAGSLDSAVTVFERNWTTGGLSYIEMYQDDSLGGSADGLAGAYGITVSPDGRYVYATGLNDDAMAIFARDTVTGKLSWIKLQQDGVDGVDGLNGATGVAVSPGGDHVYVTGSNDNAITIFRLDRATGELLYLETIWDNVDGVDGLLSAMAVTASPDGHHFYVAGQTDNAVAVFARGGRTGSLTHIKTYRKAYGLDSAASVAASPDGDHVYAAGFADNTVVVFGRNGATGELSYIEMEQDGVDNVDGLYGAHSVAISPDGNHVYVAGFHDSAVTAFERNGATGELFYVETEWDGVDSVDGLLGARAVAVSPDGKWVYVAGFLDNAVAIFERNGTTGELSYVETEWDNVDDVDGLYGAISVVASPAGDHVYVAGFYDNAVAVFDQDETSGELDFVEMVQDNVGGVDGLNNIYSVAVGPNGSHVYAAGGGDDAVAIFDRDQVTGALTYTGMEQDGVGGVDGLDGVSSVTVNPDGDRVYTVSMLDNGVTVFHRDRTSGVLSYIETEWDSTNGVDGLYGAILTAVSPDGRHVYIAGFGDDAVAVFERQFCIFLPLALR